MTYVKLEDAVKAVACIPPEWSRKGSMAKFNTITIEQAENALRSLPTDDGWEEKDAEIRRLREVITHAYRAIQDLRRKGGNGKDGDLWQKIRPITEKMFSESIYIHKDDRQFVPRDEYDAVVKRMRDLETERILNRSALGPLPAPPVPASVPDAC